MMELTGELVRSETVEGELAPTDEVRGLLVRTETVEGAMDDE